MSILSSVIIFHPAPKLPQVAGLIRGKEKYRTASSRRRVRMSGVATFDALENVRGRRRRQSPRKITTLAVVNRAPQTSSSGDCKSI